MSLDGMIIPKIGPKVSQKDLYLALINVKTKHKNNNGFRDPRKLTHQISK